MWLNGQLHQRILKFGNWNLNVTVKVQDVTGRNSQNQGQNNLSKLKNKLVQSAKNSRMFQTIHRVSHLLCKIKCKNVLSLQTFVGFSDLETLYYIYHFFMGV